MFSACLYRVENPDRTHLLRVVIRYEGYTNISAWIFISMSTFQSQLPFRGCKIAHNIFNSISYFVFLIQIRRSLFKKKKKGRWSGSFILSYFGKEEDESLIEKIMFYPKSLTNYSMGHISLYSHRF